MLNLFRLKDGDFEYMAGGARQLSDLNQADWIDAFKPDAQERLLLQDLLPTAVPEIDEVEEIEASARCFVDKGGTHVHTLFLSQTEGRHYTVSVAFILQPDRLITIREEELADFRLFRMRVRRGQISCKNPAELLVTLLEQKVENHADILEDIHRKLEQLSHVVLEENSVDLEDTISKLARQEDSNGKIRLCLADTRHDISFLLRHLTEHPELAGTCREITHDIDTLLSHTSFLFEKINFLMDSTQGFISIKQNQIIKILSIAAVVFLPPTLVASIYGMNFNVMPELKWLFGYPWALGCMIISGILPYWYFKKKRWL